MQCHRTGIESSGAPPSQRCTPLWSALPRPPTQSSPPLWPEHVGGGDRQPLAWGQGGISPCKPSLQITGCPQLPLPPRPPASAFAWGLAGGGGSCRGRRRWGGRILAGASLNLASVECHLSQTVCASLSPYQPFCSNHLRGGGREAFGEEQNSPLAHHSPPVPLPVHPGVQSPAL